MFSFEIILLLVTVTFVAALDPVDNFREGSCSKVKIHAVKANREFVDSLHYISGGSKYHLFRVASSHPNYSSLREDDFYYDACYTRNTSTTIGESIAGVRGFGRLLSTFRVTARPGIYFQAAPRDPAQSRNTVTATITMTDHKSFAVWVNCWAQVDQVGWGLVTLNGKIDKKDRLAVENHVESLGFKRENFAFLRYNSCEKNCASCHHF